MSTSMTMILAVTIGFAPLLRAEEGTVSHGASFRTKLTEWKISRVELDRSSPTTAFAEIERIMEAEHHEKVNFVLPPNADQIGHPISLKLSSLPVSEVIRYVCKDAGLSYRIETFAVVVFSGEVPVENKLITRTFRALPGAFESQIVPGQSSLH